MASVSLRKFYWTRLGLERTIFQRKILPHVAPTTNTDLKLHLLKFCRSAVPTFWAPGTGFLEDSFSMDQAGFVGGMVSG